MSGLDNKPNVGETRENGGIDGVFVVGKEYERQTSKVDLLEAQVSKDEEEARDAQCRPFKDIRSGKLFI